MTDLIFEKYEIQHRIAIGGMGEVFYAVQQQKGIVGFERPVILKSLLPELAQQEGFIEQFLDEARVAATLNHPNVVSIYEVGMWNGLYYLAMEYIRGRNLAQLLKKAREQQKPVPPAVAARIIQDAAAGLDHAHRALDAKRQPLNIVHRDISPQNIMVREDGVTKVVDFGIASAANRSSRTATGAIKGKLAYMAPEQLMQKTLTGATDQYALGIVLWELCTGKRLFTAEKEMDLVPKVLAADIPPPSQVKPGLPNEVDDIVMRMLRKEPTERYATCAEVASELGQLAQRFSPPSSESPVQVYMRALGVDDLDVLPAKQTRGGFVIPLDGSQPVDFPTNLLPAEDGTAGMQDPKSKMLTTPQSRPQRLTPKRWTTGRIAAASLATLVAAGGGGTFAATRMPQPTAALEVMPRTFAVLVKERAPTEVTPPALGKAHLTIKVTPADAIVRLDGAKLTGTPPYSAEVSANTSHFLFASRNGFQDGEKTVQLMPDGSEVVELTLVAEKRGPGPGPGPAPVGFGSAILNSTPWTSVFIDDDPWGSTPVKVRKLSVGKHRLRLVNAGAGIDTTREFVVEDGKETRVNLNLK